MADALCGPSNALQNFQKHTSVDRTLQQDRLIGRHSPSQGFRSTLGASTGAIEHEFDAFQATRPGAPQLDVRHHLPPRLAHPPQFAHTPQAPDWASDFQRLNIASPPPQHFQQQRAQAANAASSWHQDFARQQASAVQAPVLQQSAFGGMPSYGMAGFAASPYMQTPGFQNAVPLSEVAQGKQQAQAAVPAFDEAAFEQAFAQAQQDMLEEAAAEQAESQQGASAVQMDRSAVYSAIQVWSEMGLGRTEEAMSFLDNMDQLETKGHLVQDANEGRWIVDSLQRIANRDAPQEIKTRAETLVRAINQRLMSQYPLGAQVPMSAEPLWQEIDAAGYMKNPAPVQEEQRPEQKEEQPARNDDDEMATTAGRLLEKVADNTSEKFQNSQFLSLMRRLRDHQVRVEDDKIVEVNSTPEQVSAPSSSSLLDTHPSQPQPSQPAVGTTIPEIDPTILDHAVTDFGMAGYGHDEMFQQL